MSGLTPARAGAVGLAVLAVAYLSWRILDSVQDPAPGADEPAWTEVPVTAPGGDPPAEPATPVDPPADPPATADAQPEPAADPAESQPAPPPSEPPDPVAEPALVTIRPVDRVRVKVERDGQVWFSGVLCRSDDTCSEPGPMDIPAAREIAVEVADLTRAKVIYDGRQVQPLGNLTAGRRLVFVDDS